MSTKDWMEQNKMVEAAKAEILAALENGVVAKSVKRKQSGKVNAGTKTTSATSSFTLNTNSSYPLTAYLDISISEVDDISRCETHIETAMDGSAYNYVGELTNKTNLRVYITWVNSTEPKNISRGFIWQVIEFY